MQKSPQPQIRNSPALRETGEPLSETFRNCNMLVTKQRKYCIWQYTDENESMSALSLVHNNISLRNNISLQLLSSETDQRASTKAMKQIQKVMLFTESSRMSMMVEEENHFLSPLPPPKGIGEFIQNDTFLQSAVILDSCTMGVEITVWLRLSDIQCHKRYKFMTPLGTAQNISLEHCSMLEKETALYRAGACSKGSLALNFMRQDQGIYCSTGLSAYNYSTTC